jgi:hypothetical protein
MDSEPMNVLVPVILTLTRKNSSIKDIGQQQTCDEMLGPAG